MSRRSVLLKSQVSRLLRVGASGGLTELFGWLYRRVNKLISTDSRNNSECVGDEATVYANGQMQTVDGGSEVNVLRG